MKKSRMKAFKLKVVHDLTYIKKNIERWISYIIMLLCVLMFILALGSNIAHRFPVLSYFAQELKLPYLFEMSGKVHIVNCEEKMNIPIKVNVGGYSIETQSEVQYNMKFTSEDRTDIPIVISYVHNGIEYVEIEYVNYDNNYCLHCEYEYILGD